MGKKKPFSLKLSHSSLIVCSFLILLFFYILYCFMHEDSLIFIYVPWALEKNVYSAVAGCSISINVSSYCLMVLMSNYIPLANFCLGVPTLSDRWVLKSTHIIVVFYGLSALLHILSCLVHTILSLLCLLGD